MVPGTLQDAAPELRDRFVADMDDSLALYGELLEAGIRIYEYRPTMLHNKVMAVDGIWSTIGSINFVNRSMKKNAEVNIAVYDREFTYRVEAMVRADLQDCEALSLERWKRRGLVDRVAELFFFLFSENY